MQLVFRCVISYWQLLKLILNYLIHTLIAADGLNCSVLGNANEVAIHWAQLVLRWVTVSVFNSAAGKFISVYNQSPRLTQSGHPYVGMHNEYRPMGSHIL